MPGGWSLFGAIAPPEPDLFNVAMTRIVGVRYEPLQVSKQVANGTKYRYYCNASMRAPDANPGQAIVEVVNTYDPAPVVVRTLRLNP